MKYNVRPMYTAAYLCERLGLDLPWRNKFQVLMNLSEHDNFKNDERVPDIILNRNITTDGIIMAIIVGVRIGMQIADERAVQPTPPVAFKKEFKEILEHLNG